MTRAQRAFLWFSVAVSAVTGGALTWLLYAWESPDPVFQPVHASTGDWIFAHLLAVPLLVFAVGWIFQGHVLSKLFRRGRQRGTGILLLALLPVIVLSGVLVQVGVVSESTRELSGDVHTVTGALWVAVLIPHALLGRAGKKKQR